MLLIRDGPGRSVLGLGRSGTVRSASGMVRGGPGSSVLTPCWVRHDPGSVRDGPGRSVALPWWSWVIRVGSVFIRSAAVLSPGRRCFSTGRHQSRDRRSIFTPVHPGSRHLLVRGVPGLSGMVRVGSGFGVT